MVSHWLIKKTQLSLSISNSATQSLFCHFTTYLHSRFQVYGFCVRYVAKPFFSAFFLCHLLFLFLTARNVVINLDKSTLCFHIILEAFFCKKRLKHIFTTFFFYLSTPHSTHHRTCFTNSRFHQTTKLRYSRTSKFTNQRTAQHHYLQCIIRLVAVFFISGTPVPYHLEHESISSGTTFQLNGNTSFYHKTP